MVLNVPERPHEGLYKDLTAAVKEMAEDYGVRFVVNGSLNAIPASLLATKRETVIRIDAMTREQVESIPLVTDALSLLREKHLDEVV